MGAWPIIGVEILRHVTVQHMPGHARLANCPWLARLSRLGTITAQVSVNLVAREALSGAVGRPERLAVVRPSKEFDSIADVSYHEVTGFVSHR